MSNRDELETMVISVISEAVQDWDLDLDDEITGKTTLIEDLNFESIDIVQLCVAIEEKLGKKGLPFESLFIEDGSYVSDVSIAQISDFLAKETA